MTTRAVPPSTVTATAAGSGPRRFWFVGAMPPPLHGQSNCNRAMRDHLIELGAPVSLRDTGGTGAVKLVRTLAAAAALFLRARRRDRAYLSVPGQRGVWLFALLCLVLRLRRIEHVVHHHSFRPINLGPSRAMRALVAAGGGRQWHVLLSTDMRRRFADLYLDADTTPDRAATLSNAYLFASEVGAATRPARPVTLGHMSVLTREKGVPYLLALFEAAVARGRDWRLVIAGPCADAGLADALAAAMAAYPGRIDWRGPVAGAQKEGFFADIDLFVLPTTLIDEAEPLVMIEAYGRGIEVVASDTGCIRDRIRTQGHLLSLDLAADIVLVEQRVKALADDWTAARDVCVDHARAVRAEAEAEAAQVFARLLAPPRAVASGGSPVT